MKIKARLAYGLILEAEISEKSPLKLLNVDAILARATALAQPVLEKALTAAFGQLAILGVKMTMSGAKLDISAVE